LYIAAVFVRLAIAGATHCFSDPQNHYSYALMPDGEVRFLAAGLMPPGGYYIAKVLFELSGHSLAVFGLLHVLLGAFIPLLIVRLSQMTVPGISLAAARTAGWIAVVFPPLVFLSGTWRYMLYAALLGLMHLDYALRRRLIATIVVGSLLLITRPDFYLGGLAIILFASSAQISGARKIIQVVVPVLLLWVHALVAGDAGRTRNLWYNVDAGMNARSRIALVNYGPELWYAEATLADPVHDEDVHRANVLEFVRSEPVAALEALVFKLAKLLDVRRDGAIAQQPLENVVYSSSLLVVLVLTLFGMGQLGLTAIATWGWVMLGYALPMVLVFSMDRSRILFQGLWLVPCGHSVYAMLAAARRYAEGMVRLRRLVSVTRDLR
jgi:hypothetical protein